MTEEEKSHYYGDNGIDHDQEPFIINDVSATFAAIDWVTAGAVNPIQD